MVRVQRMRPGVASLRLAAADVAAMRARTQVEAAAALLARVRPRRDYSVRRVWAETFNRVRKDRIDDLHVKEHYPSCGRASRSRVGLTRCAGGRFPPRRGSER